MKIILLAVTWTIGAIAQEAVAPPPKPAPDVDSTLAPLLESLKKTLLSVGKVTWAWSFGAGNPTNQSWQKISSVTVDPHGCQAKVRFDESDGEDPFGGVLPLHFESIDTAKALSQQDGLNHQRSRLEGNSMYAAMTYYGSAYALVINGDGTGLLLFNPPILRFETQAQAAAVEEVITRAGQICRALPVTLTAAGEPSLAETLHFIEEKLSDNASASYSQEGVDENGKILFSGTLSWRLTQIAEDVPGCQLRYHELGRVSGAPSRDENVVISFRRIQKLELASAKFTAGKISLRNTSTMPLFSLSLIDDDDSIQEIHFHNEEAANRIAKAMTHAIELCGGRKGAF